MDIVVVGGHGKVAMHLHSFLVDRGHRVRAMIRNPEQADELRELGVEPVLFDLEKDEDMAGATAGADAVVFAAGAGPGSGAARKYTVDRDGALKLIDGAKKAGVERYVMLSAVGVDQYETADDEVYQAYMKAKSQADEALRKSGLSFTILRPGSLTNDDGEELIRLDRGARDGEIPRADVAAVIAYCLEHPETTGMQVELVSGSETIDEAFSSYLGGREASASP